MLEKGNGAALDVTRYAAPSQYKTTRKLANSQRSASERFGLTPVRKRAGVFALEADSGVALVVRPGRGTAKEEGTLVDKRAAETSEAAHAPMGRVGAGREGALRARVWAQRESPRQDGYAHCVVYFDKNGGLYLVGAVDTLKG